MWCRSGCPPMEDTVQALVDHLVTPLLPAIDFYSPHHPDGDQQESVAKQIHGVVILYNYYHRKRFPQLEFLEFKSFCKSASVANSNLLRYMKFMYGAESVPTKIDQLSITEKMVWDACNICSGLNEARDLSAMQSWPICKVAVLLVDSKRSNCFLQFSSITKGVWSLIEKDVGKSFDKQLNISLMDATEMKKNTNQHFQDGDEDTLKALAFYAVKEKTGISEEELTILEHDNVYSLSRQKAMARFYFMQYTGTSNDEVAGFPIKDVLDRLQGPLLTEDYMVTHVVEYFHLLPYMDVLSCWVTRQNFNNGSSFSMGNKEIFGENIPAEQATIENFKISGSSIGETENVKVKEKSKENSKGIIGKQNKLNCMIGQLEVACRPHDGCKYNPSKQQEMTEKRNATETVKSTIQNMHVNKENICIKDGSLVHTGVPGDKVCLDGSHIKPCNFMSNYARLSSGRDACNALIYGPGGGAVTDHLPPVSMSSKKFKEILPFPRDNIQALMETKKRDILEASLSVLWRKREELQHQQQLLEDEIAKCEMNILRISSEEEDNLILKLDSIIEACNTWCSKQVYPGYVNQNHTQTSKRRRLCEAVLSPRSSCQDLHEICCENHWMLPRYSILPSLKQGYRASVTIRGPDFECKGEGDPSVSPQESRQSAAAHALNNLRNMANQAILTPDH